MPSYITEGIILKRRDFGEADRVLTVLSDRFGKISVIAKGVRRITSRRGGNIELLNRVKLHLFKGKNYTLTEAESLETFPWIKENLTLSTSGFHIVELADRLTAEGEKNSQVYELTLKALRLLEQNPRQVYIRWYEVKLLSLLGFWSTDALKDPDPEIKEILEKLEFGQFSEIDKLQLKPHQAMALEEILRYYIEGVLESNLRSIKVMEKLRKK